MSAAAGMVKVGSLACQRDSFLRRLTTKVVGISRRVEAIAPPAAAAAAAGKSAKAAPPAAAAPAPPSWELLVEDSVLFPEGGGQPCDLGTVSGKPVANVFRRGDECVIVLPSTGAEDEPAPFSVGSEVDLEVDWPRREDHMQHHSAQHLLTAVVEEQLKLPTEAWSLTSPACFIQVPAASIKPEDVARVEEICNNIIAGGRPVVCQTYASKAELPEARSRSIPADVTGPIRVIDIAGVDACTCCGTHVTDLRQLQAIKLLHQEAKGQTCRLFFVAGRRVLNMFGDMYARERALVKEVGINAAGLLAAVERRGRESAAGAKTAKKLLAEVAQLFAPAFVASVKALPPAAGNPAIDTHFFHREDADMEFLNTLATALGPAADVPRVVVLACGSLKEDDDGAFMIVGKPSDLQHVADVLLPLIDGKGGLTKQGFRGKCNLKKWKAALKQFAASAAPPTPAAAAAAAPAA